MANLNDIADVKNLNRTQTNAGDLMSAVIIAVAGALWSVWKSTPAHFPPVTPGAAFPDGFADVIKKLVDAFNLVLPADLPGGVVPQAVLESVLAKIQDVKKQLQLPLNNFLDTDTVTKILAIAGACVPGDTGAVRPTTPDNTDAASASSANAGQVISYKIDISVPSTIGGQDTAGLVRAAASNWGNVVEHLLFLPFTEAKNGYFNVTLINAALGPGVLGEAPVAGRDNLGGKMELKLDMIKLSDPGVFVETVTHEFGHIAGLSHNMTNPLAIMSPIIPQNVTELTDDDKNNIQAIWGAI